MNSQRLVVPIRWTIATATLAGIVLGYRYWAHVNPTTVALTLLMFVLVLAAEWGLRYAVTMSLAATACYNFFFLPPVGTFVISDPQNWVALLAFLGVSVTASRLSARIREEAREARDRQREVEVLYELSRELLQTENVAELLNSTPSAVARVLGASGVLLFLLDGERVYRSGKQAGGDMGAGGFEVPQLKELAYLPTVTAMREQQGRAIPLRTGVRTRGVLAVQAVDLSDKTMEAIGGLVSVSIDRAQALEEVTRSEAAKASERLRGVMLDSITHELRTPLTSIKASVTTLLGVGTLGEGDRVELLTVIDEESDRLNHLVAQSLEMTQLDTQEIHMSLEPHAPGELIEQAVVSCGGMLEGRTVRVTVPERLPMVEADPVWIEKVLSNLLENAVKYSGAEQPIFLSAEASGGAVGFSVADRGMGIDAMDQALIFDKFYRGRSHRQRVPGTGMGLAICRAILEAHHGSIQVTSQPGQGSVFTFRLPVAG